MMLSLHLEEMLFQQMHDIIGMQKRNDRDRIILYPQGDGPSGQGRLRIIRRDCHRFKEAAAFRE